MTKLAIGTIPLEMSATNIIQVRCKGPARIVGGFIAYKQASRLVVREKPATVPVPTLIVEFDPDAELVERTYVGLIPGVVLDREAAPLLGCPMTPVWAFVNPNDGRPLVVYEATLGDVARGRHGECLSCDRYEGQPHQATCVHSPPIDDRPEPVSGEIGAAT